MAQKQQEAHSQASSKRIFIEQIIVLGNKKTRASVILREMKSKAGQQTTVEQLELDRRRIESLGLFNRVEMHLQPKENGYRLIITVSEQWYLFPFPIIFFNDRDISLKKLSYGLGVIHTNFRGRAELLQFAGWLGYNPTASVMYNNPWIFGRRQFFTRLQFLIANQVNKTYDIIDQRVNEKRLGGSWTFGKRLTPAYLGESVTVLPAGAAETGRRWPDAQSIRPRPYRAFWIQLCA
ncbi:MAG: POTRA domain-containing protein [candidate division KSB1 bacterium]|nr:POTRA domain-containing protein [candidate division KSB1 bacterium]